MLNVTMFPFQVSGKHKYRKMFVKKEVIHNPSQMLCKVTATYLTTLNKYM